MRKIAVSISFTVTMLTPTIALAYVGPGAGLSLLGALWALVAAIGTALIFIVVWPVRKALRRRRAMHGRDAADAGPKDTVSDGHPVKKNR
ncbi:hypothetical protein [Nitratireductor luteus]|uniref:hypothetical protein n=1 Tax=Nitratireductor luteus TaxID=2976980 RepID=UPI00223F1BC4|nr:hypothetical protein [Nitratireductor luteus]